MSEQLFTIGDVARRTGVAVSALRYYEEVGLMPLATRVSGQRRYPASTVQLVSVILLLQEVGFSLREMKLFLGWPSDPSVDWRALARHKMADLDERITKAQAARNALEHALVCPHIDIWDCPNFSTAVEARRAGIPLDRSHSH